MESKFEAIKEENELEYEREREGGRERERYDILQKCQGRKGKR
jgi:hypothetical protein